MKRHSLRHGGRRGLRYLRKKGKPQPLPLTIRVAPVLFRRAMYKHKRTKEGHSVKGLGLKIGPGFYTVCLRVSQACRQLFGSSGGKWCSSHLIALTPHLQYADSIPEVAFQLMPTQLSCQEPPKAKYEMAGEVVVLKLCLKCKQADSSWLGLKCKDAKAYDPTCLVMCFSRFRMRGTHSHWKLQSQRHKLQHSSARRSHRWNPHRRGYSVCSE